VVWASELEPRRPDEGWLALAESEGRLVLTNDKDFGELVFHRREPSTFGVILLRFRDMPPGTLAVAVLAALDDDREWYGFFTTLTGRRPRQTRLPDLGSTP
jgi:predicted nuclease of predicted toxin-antitoxin system